MPDTTIQKYTNFLTCFILYLILFLHDLGKDQGPKGHCERGVEIAGSMMDRLGQQEDLYQQREDLQVEQEHKQQDLLLQVLLLQEQLLVKNMMDHLGQQVDLWEQVDIVKLHQEH